MPVPPAPSTPAGSARLADPARLAAVRATGLLDAPTAPVLDRLARAASRLLDAPVALVSLVDEQRVWFAGRAGPAGEVAQARQAEFVHAFCQHVVAEAAPLVVDDVVAHAVGVGSRAAQDLGVRAYIGVPLTTHGRHVVGTLCALDTAPRRWPPDAVDGLADLAAAAVAELELRETVAALRASEAHYRAAMELNPQVPWVADAEGRVVEISPSWEALTGLDAATARDSGWHGSVHPDDRAAVTAAWRRAVATGEGYDVQHRLRVADGSYRWQRSRARAQREPAADGGAPGPVVRWYGWTEDVHDRVLAEREQARFALAARATVDGLWSWDVATDEVFHSPRYRELLGYGVEEFSDSREAFYAVLHADDRPRLDDAVRAHLARRAPYAVEVRLRHRDGGWRWFWIRGQAEWDADGRPLRMVGSASDVTARRAAEAALRESEARYRAFVEQAADPIFVIAADGRLLDVNRAACESIGYTREELLARRVTDVAASRDAAALHDLLERAAAGETLTVQGAQRRRDGAVIPVEVRVGPVQADGETRVLAIARDQRERQAAETALRESEARFRQLAENITEMFWLVEIGPTFEESRLLYVNAAYSRITGRPAEAFHQAPALGLDRVLPEDRARLREAGAAAAAGEPQTVEYRIAAEAGPPRTVRSRLYPIRDADGCVFRIGGFTEDITEQRALEERLRQAQKMEAVGQLAGGIAHDFNNLLTVIAGNLEFAHADLPPDVDAAHPLRGDLDEIGRAADRARALVRQLLAFSRRQPVRPQRVDLAELVRGAERMLRRVIGEEIVLEVQAAPPAGAAGADGEPAVTVHADPAQLEQVLLNLAVNARDAMLTARHGHPGTGGVLGIDVEPMALDAERARAWDGLVPGRYVGLRVRDTGHGMDAAARAHAFEPFFTTKAVGAGTGLGLATVFGIVRQAGGALRLDSAPGQGTTVTVLLPAAPDGQAADPRGTPPGGTPRAGAADGDAPGTLATVLLVEDEAPVRATARRMLERHGYRVLEARHGADALLLWREHAAAVDVAVTDLRMPELGGRDLVTRLRAERPGLPVVFMSGYADQVERAPVPGGDRRARQALVEKPFTAEALLAAVARVLRADRGA